MKTAVIYYSDSGNTAKVAAAIRDALAGEVVTGSVKDDLCLDDCDLVFVGMPILKFVAPGAVSRYLEQECAGRRVALFVTHAAPEDLDEAQPWLEACKEAAGPADLIGFFHCQGQLAEPVRQWMLGSGSPQLTQFAEMSSCADGQPDDAALRRAASFARETLRRAEAELSGDEVMV